MLKCNKLEGEMCQTTRELCENSFKSPWYWVYKFRTTQQIEGHTCESSTHLCNGHDEHCVQGH